MAGTPDVEKMIKAAQATMDKSLDSLDKDLAKIRSGRASPALLESVMVDYYGTPTPLRSLANVTAPEARQLVVQAFDPKALGEMERAILKSDLGLMPQNDGKLLRVPIPVLTEERRRDLVKSVKRIAEDHKQGVRHARRDGIAAIKDAEKHGLSEDDSRKAQKRVQDLTDLYTKKIETQIASKEEDILRI